MSEIQHCKMNDKVRDSKPTLPKSKYKPILPKYYRNQSYRSEPEILNLGQCPVMERGDVGSKVTPTFGQVLQASFTKISQNPILQKWARESEPCSVPSH